MRESSRRILVIALLSAWASLAAAAAPILDQENDPVGIVSGSQFNQTPRAQTFVAGQSGDLVAIEVLISQLDPTGNLLAALYQTQDELGGSTMELIGFATLPVSSLSSSSPGGTGPGWVSIAFDPPAPIVAGDALALVLQRDTGGTGPQFGLYWRTSLDTYPNGDAFRYQAGGPAVCLREVPCPPFIPASWETLTALNPDTNEFEAPDFGFRTFVEPSTAVPTSSIFTTLLLALATLGTALLLLGRRQSQNA